MRADHEHAAAVQHQARFFGKAHEGWLADKPPYDPDMFVEAKRCYYYLMGWDSAGKPNPCKLAELGIPQ